MISQAEEKQEVREGKKSGVIFCIPLFHSSQAIYKPLFHSSQAIYKQSENLQRETTEK